MRKIILTLSPGMKFKDTSVTKGHTQGKCCQSVHTVGPLQETFLKPIDKELKHESSQAKIDEDGMCCLESGSNTEKFKCSEESMCQAADTNTVQHSVLLYG